MQNQYQRRADLIPNLVETVKGYAKQEQTVLTAGGRGARQGDADDRSRPTSSPTRRRSSKYQEAQGQLGAALGRLIVDHRELSGPEVEPELPGAAVAARRHREPHRGGAARLHRGGAASTTPSSGPSPAASGRWLLYHEHKPMETFTIDEEKMQAPEVKFN